MNEPFSETDDPGSQMSGDQKFEIEVQRLKMEKAVEIERYKLEISKLKNSPEQVQARRYEADQRVRGIKEGLGWGLGLPGTILAIAALIAYLVTVDKHDKSNAAQMLANQEKAKVEFAVVREQEALRHKERMAHIAATKPVRDTIYDTVEVIQTSIIRKNLK